MILQISDKFRIRSTLRSWDVEKRIKNGWQKLYYFETLASAFHHLQILEIKTIPGSDLQQIKDRIIDIENRTFEVLSNLQITL